MLLGLWTVQRQPFCDCFPVVPLGFQFVHQANMGCDPRAACALARDAIRKARNVGLLFSVERRRRGQKSLTNIVRVLRKSWGVWLQRIGCRNTRSAWDKILKYGTSGVVANNARDSNDPLRRWKGS